MELKKIIINQERDRYGRDKRTEREKLKRMNNDNLN